MVMDRCVRIHKNNSVFSEINVTPSSDTQPIQSVVWGQQSTSNVIFASSGLEHWNSHNGFHKAFDIEKNKLVHTLDSEGCGECLDVSPRGTSPHNWLQPRLKVVGNEVALVTSCEDQQFRLSMYDLRSKSYITASRHVTLSRLPRWFEDTDETHRDPKINKLPSSINQILYSPDGVYIAVARSDNMTQIYDSRFLDRVLYRFRHKPGIEGTVDDMKFGVYRIEWVTHPISGRPSLVSGGADGAFSFLVMH